VEGIDSVTSVYLARYVWLQILRNRRRLLKCDYREQYCWYRRLQ